VKRVDSQKSLKTPVRVDYTVFSPVKSERDQEGHWRKLSAGISWKTIL